MDEQYLERNHRNFVKEIEIKLIDKFKNWNDIAKPSEYKNKFID